MTDSWTTFAVDGTPYICTETVNFSVVDGESRHSHNQWECTPPY